MFPANNTPISRLSYILTQSLLCFPLAISGLGGIFGEVQPVGLNQKVLLQLGVFAAGHCKLVSPAQGDGKICSISQKQVCFVSAVAEGCSLNLYFNGMKCN